MWEPATLPAILNWACAAYGARLAKVIFQLRPISPLYQFTHLSTTLDHILEDYYAVLGVSSDATYPQIRSAYHAALLKHHPDKHKSPGPSDDHIQISLIKQSFLVLSSPDLRLKYDRGRQNSQNRSGPRPAEVISLEDFDFHPETLESAESWQYQCRCGGRYSINEAQMEQGVHLVGCNSCSEVVWVGFELDDS